MKRAVIAGGSGFLGQALARRFHKRGWEITVLSREPTQPLAYGAAVGWDGETLDQWAERLAGADALINLCGKSVNCRYTPANRDEIRNSRLRSTRVLGTAVKESSNPPKVWLNASSATIYAASAATPMDETSGIIGRGFSEGLCVEWERAFFEPILPSTRRVALRSSLVLGRSGNSALPILARLARLGFGGPIGGGRQMVSWIHARDFARAAELAIVDPSIEGPLNVTAPAPLSNAAFMAEIRRAVGRRFGFPTPRPLLEIGAFFGRTESELALKSRFAYPGKLLERRFLFDFPFVDEALADLLRPDDGLDCKGLESLAPRAGG